MSLDRNETRGQDDRNEALVLCGAGLSDADGARIDADGHPVRLGLLPRGTPDPAGLFGPRFTWIR